MVFLYKNVTLRNFSRAYNLFKNMVAVWEISLQWERCKDQKSDHFVSWMMEDVQKSWEVVSTHKVH